MRQGLKMRASIQFGSFSQPLRKNKRSGKAIQPSRGIYFQPCTCFYSEHFQNVGICKHNDESTTQYSVT